MKRAQIDGDKGTKPQPCQAGNVAGRPVSFWQDKLSWSEPIAKEAPKPNVRTERMAKKELEAICSLLGDSRIGAKDANLEWWLENASTFNPQDAAKIILAMLPRRGMEGREGFEEKVKDALFSIEDPEGACAAVAGMLKNGYFPKEAYIVLERDISKYSPKSAAKAIDAGIAYQHSQSDMHFAGLIGKLPQKYQVEPLITLFEWGGKEDVEAGKLLLEKHAEKTIARIIGRAMVGGFKAQDCAYLAARIGKLPRGLQEAPLQEAILHDDEKVMGICFKLLEGLGQEAWGRTLAHALKAPGAHLATFPLMAKMPEKPKRTRRKLILAAIKNASEKAELEGVRLLGLEKNIGRDVTDLLEGKEIRDKARCALYDYLGTVEEGKRAKLIMEGIKREKKVGKAAFSQIRLAPEGERAALWYGGYRNMDLGEGVDLKESFASLPPAVRAEALEWALEAEDNKKLQAFAPLICELDYEGMKRIVPKALRSMHGHVFHYAHQALSFLDEEKREGMCDYTADEIRHALSQEWTDAIWLTGSLNVNEPKGSQKYLEREKLVMDSANRIRAMMLAPFIAKSERGKVAEMACDSMEEFIKEADWEFRSLGTEAVKLIALQPEHRQEALYGEAAKMMDRQLEPV
ncbi:MAG: hypothetical protein WC717_04705, partial [Candidatus Micrarchaeia archaeon]